MRYAVDLGNSAAKAALFSEGALRSLRVAAPANSRQPAAWTGPIATLLDLIASERIPATSLRVASVVPAATAALHVASAARSIPLDEIEARDVPIELAVDEPGRIGVDRVLAAWRAYATLGAPAERGAIAVTLGTALTITCVDRHGRVIGGAIAPSPLLAARALSQGTAVLPEVTLYDESPDLPSAIGSSTESALAAGILRGSRAALIGLIADASAEMLRRDPGAPAPALALGGGAASAGWSAGIAADLREPDLVLHALLALPERASTGGQAR